MSFEISTNLKLIYIELRNQTEYAENRRRFDFMQLLRCLNSIEKYLIARAFCTLTWNIGSSKVLGILQELCILTASEFVLNLQDIEQIQLILNDFFEAEYELLENLFTAAHYDSLNAIKLNSILEESLNRLFSDLLENTNLNELKYLENFKKDVPDFLLELCLKHTNVALALHDSNLKDAYLHFSDWINEGVDRLKFNKDLFDKLLCYAAQETLSHLFKLSIMEHFKYWKFYLILLQTIASRCIEECGAFIRKYLKTRLRQIAISPCKTAMLHLLLTTRAATATTEEVNQNIDAYANWYKQNIGDMKFALKTDEFQNVLTLLEQCVEYEQEEEYIEVHSSISISPPVMCGKMVRDYRSKCKLHLCQLKNKAKAVNKPPHAESILIEDSD